MIDLTPPFYTVGAGEDRVVVFRDHEDPDLFHALPARPRLARRGEAPTFKLYRYRFPLEAVADGSDPGVRGGGLALFETEVGLEGARLEAVRAEVARESGRVGARLQPALFRGGTAHAILGHADAEDAIVEDQVERRPVAPVPPHAAAFAFHTSPEGASLLTQAARGDDIPVGVVYELRFEGLLPAMNARVRMDYERCYDRFAASLGGQYYYVRAELGVDLAWLTEHDAIQVEITHFTSDADRARQEEQAMALVRARIEQDFFRPAMPRHDFQPGPLSALLGGLLGSGEADASSALFVLKAKFEMERELKTFELTFDRRQAVEMTHVCAGRLAGMFGDATPDITDLTLGDDFFRRLDLRIISNIPWQSMPDLTSVAVHVDHPLRQATFLFEPGGDEQHTFSVPLSSEGDDAYRWRALCTFAPGSEGPSAIEAGPFESRTRILAISPAELARYVRVRVIAGAVDFGEVRHMAVHLRMPDPEGGDDLVAGTVVLSAEAPEATWRAHLPLSAGAATPVLARVRTVLSDGRTHEGEERPAGAVLVAESPFRARRSVRFVCVADWEVAAQVVVDAHYGEGAARAEHTLVFQPGGEATAAWSFLQTDPSAAAWTYRELVVLRDGTTVERDPVTTTERSVVVGRLDAPAPTVQIVLVGDLAGAAGLMVRLWPADAAADAPPAASVFLQPGDTRASVQLPGGEGPLRYRWRATRITGGGEEPHGEGTSDTQILVLQAQAPGG